MKNKRRCGVLLAGLLCFCMVVSLPALAETGEGSASPDAVGQAVFELSYPSELPAVGETFEVTVSLKDNPGFANLDFGVSSDSSVVECQSLDVGDVLNGMFHASNYVADKGALFAAAAAENNYLNGVVAKIHYKVIGDGESGFELKNINFGNEADEKLKYSIQYPSGNIDAPPVSPTDNPSGSPSDPPGDTPSGRPSDLPSDRSGDDPATPPTDQPGSSPTTPPSEQPGGVSAENPGGTSPGEAPAETTPVKYNDITDAHWAYDYVYRATAAGLFNGFPDGGFHPDENVTRAQFITVLWRMSQSPDPGAGTSVQFTDTPSGEYYYDAVRWGVDNHLINGMENTDGTFSYLPGATITREQVMTILFRYDGEKSGMESLFTTTYDSQFTDSEEISDYAKKAMYWAYFKTYISGTSANTLSPKGLATRAQISRILVEYLAGNQE